MEQVGEETRSIAEALTRENFEELFDDTAHAVALSDADTKDF